MNDWLHDQQKRSWEPEILLSGIILAFLLAFPTTLYETGAAWVQDGTLPYLGALLMQVYVSFVVNLFLLFFLAHLALRLAWAGLLGLSYAFPDGVVKERLFKVSQDYDYPHPDDLVLKLERICSMAFGFPLAIGLIVLGITAYLALLMLLYHVFDLEFSTIYLLFMLSMVVFALVTQFQRKSRFVQGFATGLQSTIFALYQSHLGRWTIFLYLTVFTVAATPLVLNDTRHFLQFFNSAGLQEADERAPLTAWAYADALPEGTRFPRALIASERVSEDVLEIRIAAYPDDTTFVTRIPQAFPVTLDTLGWRPLTRIEDLYRISVGDSVRTILDSRRDRMPRTDQEVLRVLVDISDLGPGYHDVHIEKLVVMEGLLFRADRIRHRDPWALIPFRYVTDP